MPHQGALHMSVTVKLIGLAVLMMAVILLSFGLFGASMDAALQSVLDDPPSAALVAGVVFAALASDVFLPLPSSLLSAVAVAWLGPVAGVAVIWAGMTTGHFIGYLVGARYGTPAVARIAGDEAATRLTSMGESVGMSATLALTRAVPVLSEACAVIAGASGMSTRRFLFVTATANLGVALVYGALLAISGDAAPFLLVFAASIIVPVLGYGLLRLVTGRAG